MADQHWLDAWQALRDLHEDKSSTYGTGADALANFIAVSDATGDEPERYALLRIIEKASRALHQLDAGNGREVAEYPDMAGLALCAEGLRKRR